MTKIPVFEGTVTVSREEVVWQNHFLKIVDRTLKHTKFDGTMSDDERWVVSERKGGSAVLVHNIETNKFLLVEQFRPAVYFHVLKGVHVGFRRSGWVLELVAGGFGKDSPIECAKREAMEEAGIDLDIDMLTSIPAFYLSPGITPEIIFPFYAPIMNKHVVGVGGGLADENEDVRLHWISPSDARKMISTGEICDAKTINCIQWFFLKDL